jgi:hypothetical protein
MADAGGYSYSYSYGYGYGYGRYGHPGVPVLGRRRSHQRNVRMRMAWRSRAVFARRG